MDEFNLSALDNLSPAEKELALSILKEYSEKGESQKYNDLLMEDYEEMPVDILTFVDDYRYLGNAWHDSEGKTKLYPYWREELKKIFPDNLTTNFNNAILTGSRGRGKALPNSSYVATASGNRQVKDIQIGDYLLDRNNNLTKVLGVFPQGKKDVYELTFEDNRTARCCIDHLWTCITSDNEIKTLSLRDILNIKEEVYIPLNISDEHKFNKKYLKISNIQKLNYSEEMTCFYVDNKEHLFQLDNGIVTHNTEIAILMAAYLLHRVLCLKDPVAHYRLKPTEKLVFAFMNIKLALAEEIGVAKFQNTIQSSPWFLEHGTLEGRTRKVWVPKKFNDKEAVDIKIGSQADDLIGLPIFFCFCLDGDTVIKTSEGLKSLKECENKQIQVYSINEKKEECLSDICTVKCTSESSIEYQIELEDGSIIKCTPNHMLMLKDGSYKRADELTEDDELFESSYIGEG